MKKLFTILFLALCFVACSDDDSNSSLSLQEEQEVDILGTWQLVETYDEEYYHYCHELHTKTFSDDNTLTGVGYSGENCVNRYEYEEQYNFEGDNSLVFIDVNGGPEGDTDYIEKYNVESLTEDKLTLEMYFIDEGWGDGGESVSEGAVEIYERIE